jgi:hypothetical protein
MYDHECAVPERIYLWYCSQDHRCKCQPRRLCLPTKQEIFLPYYNDRERNMTTKQKSTTKHFSSHLLANERQRWTTAREQMLKCIQPIFRYGESGLCPAFVYSGRRTGKQPPVEGQQVECGFECLCVFVSDCLAIMAPFWSLSLSMQP